MKGCIEMAHLDELVDFVRKKILNKERSLIAIDDFGGSGKSTLSNILVKELGVFEVVRMDDFYLPTNQRPSETKSNLPDGAFFDLDRLKNQVLVPYKQNQAVTYQKYDWIKDKLSEKISVDSTARIVVEGVYVLHEDIRNFFDLKIWVDCELDLRLHRGLLRDGENPILFG